MIFALGFLIAGLLALVIAPAFWARAIRLSTRRLEMLVPLSAREIIAERDLLRAEFAVERRQFEQKAEHLNEIRTSDLAELGRRAAQIVARDAKYAALAVRHADQGADLAGARQALANALSELAASASALYGVDGLLERKDADLIQLRRDLGHSRAQVVSQSAALADMAAQAATRQAHLEAARDELARLRADSATLGLERDAYLATLEATAAQLADREEALKLADKRQIELQRRRESQIEKSRTRERELNEEIERIRAGEAAARQLLEAARTEAVRLGQELFALRRLNAAPTVMEREENAILRQNINEIGAAIIRMAGLALEPAPSPQDQFNSQFDESEDKIAARGLAKANVAAKANIATKSN